MWRFLRHRNVLPLIGVMVSDNRFSMVSCWMSNGNINQFIKAHPEANRLELVGPHSKSRFFTSMTIYSS